jgi:nucleotide-binding universal stress UspA family protein
MTYVVPFDGTSLSRAALTRAGELAEDTDETVLAVTVIPAGNARFARERDLLGAEESFDHDAVVAELRSQVEDLCPDADLAVETTGRYAPPGGIATDLREMATDADASLVVIGSNNAGRMVSTISSVGGSVASDDDYDVLVVRGPADA